MELGSGRPDHAVRRPRVDEVRLRGEVRTGIVMRVARRGDLRVVVRRQQGTDCRRDRRTALDRERAPLAEVVLHVDDDQATRHEATSTYRTSSAGSPGDRLI